MEKATITTNWRAHQFIILARSFQSVQKQVAQIVDNDTDDISHTTLVNIDNKVSDILESLCNIIGAEIIHGQ